MSRTIRITAEQIEKDLNSGFMHSLIAFGDKGEVAAYALYYLYGSSTKGIGQIMHLEDIYIRPQFRRKGIGFLLLEELAKIAYSENLPFIEWQVLRSNFGAIKFYKKLSGLIDETDDKEKNKCNLWRLSAQSFDYVLQKEAKQKESDEKLIKEIYLDNGEISESNSFYLAEQWNNLIKSQKNGEEEENNEFLLDNQSLAKLLNSGLLGVIVVKKKENNKIVGMAFFNRKGYSTWQGRFLILDNIFVVDSEKEKGIGTSIMAELVNIAQKMEANKIQWETNKENKIVNSFFKSLNAENLTENEGWLIYRWYFNKQK
uniref:N-acetyltransferase domain-containing protein n=1 Tax=Meloidogyne enterolobii TaxID=390850 RepID=A0A6V7V845_MELEN|nr:unnamed protein product [Meloidogyne enterolobii]